jgi:hypothetical protein
MKFLITTLLKHNNQSIIKEDEREENKEKKKRFRWFFFVFFCSSISTSYLSGLFDYTKSALVYFRDWVWYQKTTKKELFFCVSFSAIFARKKNHPKKNIENTTDEMRMRVTWNLSLSLKQLKTIKTTTENKKVARKGRKCWKTLLSTYECLCCTRTKTFHSDKMLKAFCCTLKHCMFL